MSDETTNEQTTETVTETTRTTETTEQPGPPQPSPAPQLGPEQLQKVREFVISANPDAVPDLITGNTVEEIEASIPKAKDAYQRTAERVRATYTPPPAVPAGGAANLVNPDDLSPSEKIRRGIAQGKGQQ